MLPTKAFFGSGEENFGRFLPYMGVVAIFRSQDGDNLNKLSFPHPIEAPYEIWLWLAKWFLRRCLKSVDDGRMTELTFTISSPMSLKAQVS